MNSREFEPVDADVEPYGVVAIASSAGGVTALGKVLGGLPADLAVPVLVVQPSTLGTRPSSPTCSADVLR